MPEHPLAKKGKGSKGYVNEHVLIAERALGKLLPAGAVVHHVNSIRDDNRNCNLVICQDDTYHKLLHYRTRIVQAGGDPNTEKICGCCKRVKRLEEFRFNPQTNDGRYGQCKVCTSELERCRKEARNPEYKRRATRLAASLFREAA